MTTDPELTHPSSGRPVTLTPVRPGVWLIIGGSVLAALGPLFGFLVGSILGSTTDTAGLTPIYLFLFVGLVLGGLGVGAVLLGVRRVVVDRRGQRASEAARTD